MSLKSKTERQVTELPAGRTAYLDRGAGPVLVLAHGVGLNASVWQPQLEAFDDEYRVLAYDTLGHGGSALPTEDADLPEYVCQLRELLDDLDIENAILLGHSMGALIATRFAIEEPGRVTGLVAANPVYRRPERQLAVSRTRARELATRGSEAALDEALVRWFGEDGSLDVARVAQVRRWVSGADPQGYARAYRVFSEADPWLAGRLEALDPPALFITGALDPNSTPAMAHAMAAEAPRGQVCVLEGERHMMAYASPQRFNGAVREFIDGLDRCDAMPLLSGRQAGQA